MTKKKKRENILHCLIDEILRNKELIKIYESIPTGSFAIHIIKQKIERAEKSISNYDTYEMIKSYKELEDSE